MAISFPVVWKGCANYSECRRALPQILAAIANNLIMLDLMLVVSFPTVAIADLLNSSDSMSLTDNQASWFVGVTYLCQPIGSILSGLYLEPIGRKKAMLLLNLFFLAGWILMYIAQSLTIMYLACAILGFSVGCAEAPTAMFIGEVAEAKYRGTLASSSQLTGTFSYFLMYLLGMYMSWRYAALSCATVPILNTLAILPIPETPLWLLSKGRIQEAEKALAWLRGWVPVESIRTELSQMTSHQRPDDSEEVTNFFRPELRRPLIIVISYFFLVYGSGLQTMRPFLVQIMAELGTDGRYGTVLVAVSGIVGLLMCLITVRPFGKRLLSLISFIGSGFATFLLSLQAFGVVHSKVWAMTALLGLSFFTSVGISSMPWMLQSELYPYRGKCLAAGIGSAASYLIGFVCVKMYLPLEGFLTLGGVQLLFTGFSILGTAFIYFKLPETEGRTLEEISLYFK